MTDEEKIRRSILEIARRRSSVTLEEIESVVRRLGKYCSVNVREAKHGKLFRVNDQIFMVNAHNPGSKTVKKYSVDDFLNAMTELEWYED